MEKIYIQIPSYRDTELAPTLVDILEKAHFPGRIRIGVCWQHSEDEKLPKIILDNQNIEIINIHYSNSNGCNWARRELQKKWNGEEYTMLIDSHHRFVDNWDTQLIEMYNNLKNGGIQKPLITGYLPPYSPDDPPYEREQNPLKIFSLSRERGLLIYLVAQRIPLWHWLKKPIKAEFASLHFIFTSGSFNKEIIFDDDIYFFGDEVLVGLKAFTHGYDLFHPHYVIGWHLYNRQNTRITHWDDHKDGIERHEKSYQKLRDIFLGIEKEGLGKVRTVEDYEYLISNKLLIS